MLKTEIIDELFGARDSIADQIIAIQPRNDEEKAKLDELRKQYDRLSSRINDLIEVPFRNHKGELVTPLEDAVKHLEDATRRLKALKKTMDGIQAAIETADQVVKLASNIIALAA